MFVHLRKASLVGDTSQGMEDLDTTYAFLLTTR